MGVIAFDSAAGGCFSGRRARGWVRHVDAGDLDDGLPVRPALVAVAPPGETAYTAMPGGSRRASAATHQAMMSFASAYALLGTYLTFGPLRIRASTAAARSPRWYLAAKAGTSVYLNMGTPPRAGSAPAITIRALGLSRLARSKPTVS